MTLLGAPEEVRDMVRNGEGSASTAMRVVRKDQSNAAATLKAAKAASGKKKATAKGLAKAAGKPTFTNTQITIMVHALQRIAKRDSDEGKLAAKALASVGM